MTAALEAVDPGVQFFKKLTLRVGKQDAALVELATACRAEGVLEGDVAKAREWAETGFLPHLSLM